MLEQTLIQINIFRGRGGSAGFYRGGRGRGVNQGYRGRGGGAGRGGFQPGRPTGGKKETLKFEGEYDFDKANEEFKEVLEKLQVSGDLIPNVYFWLRSV